jgi:hypothetical protein
VLAAWRAAPITVELSVGIQVVGFEVAVDALAARSSGATAGRRFDDHQRRLIFLGHFRRREPGLLQRGKLAEQRFLQRSSHNLSLQPVTCASPRTDLSIAAAPHRATPVVSIHPSAASGSPATLLDLVESG